jgi:hypothetical protein
MQQRMNHLGTIGRQEVGMKEIVVTPLGVRREATALLVAIGIIVSLMTVRFYLVSSGKEETELKSYQRLDFVLKGQQPILYRSLLSAVDEVVALREEGEGQWPEVAFLQDEALPPFAKIFLPVALKAYGWSKYGGKSWVDYYGVDARGEYEKNSGHEAVTFLLRIIDLHGDEEHPHPHPGLDYDPSMRYAKQVWIFNGNSSYPGEDLPEAGWKWVISSTDPSLGENSVISETPDDFNDLISDTPEGEGG